MDAHNKRRIAVQAACEPPSVERYLRGELKRGTVHARISQALHELGYDDLVRPMYPDVASMAMSNTPKTMA